MNLPDAVYFEAARRFPTPFHLYDEGGIRAGARRLNAAFTWNPGYRQYFAVKAAPTPALLALLRDEGCGLDCSSLTELQLAEAGGFRGDEVILTSNVTPDEDFLAAARLGAIVNLDDLSHLPVVEALTGLPATVCLRFNPGDEFPSSNAVMDSPARAKYGLTRPQLMEGYRTLAARGVERLGLHAFLASATLDPTYYPRLARFLFETAVAVLEETGLSIGFIDLSGGLGIPYGPDDQALDLEAVAAEVRRAYEEVLVPRGLAPALATELGRWMTGPYGCLVARVLREKRIHRHYLGLDACAADLMRPAMYGSYHRITVPGKAAQPTAVYDVTGGLCENNDKFAQERELPVTGPGDLVVIHDTGAHGRSMGYNYNGKLRSAEVLYQTDGTLRLIRRAETPADYFATLEGFGAPGADVPACAPGVV